MGLGLGKKKKTKDIDNLPEDSKSAIEANKFQSEGIQGMGINGEFMQEPVPFLNQSGCEVVYKNQNNAWIVLGRDRPAARSSGYGGAGASGAGSIDLCVGRMSGARDGPKSNIYADPNFKSDAARIYISQKTDIDKNFELPAGNVGLSTARSGIAIKADAVRVIGREGIKLVTGLGTREKNSLGEPLKTVRGIDLIAGNDDESGSADLQPIVKGTNLVEALRDVNERVDEMNGILNSFLMAQMQLNIQMATHFHQSPLLGLPTTPSATLLAAGVQATVQELTNCYGPLYLHKVNLMLDEFNNLKPFGSNWICSRYNRAN
tara:strand:+ start:109 stop:1065 length:957 start_codon:yes stop_codon:yes gene_type:complete